MSMERVKFYSLVVPAILGPQLRLAGLVVLFGFPAALAIKVALLVFVLEVIAGAVVLTVFDLW